MTEKQRAKKCLAGESQFICKDCADLYGTNEPYMGINTYHNNTCFICEQTKMVTSSRKLLSLHHFL